MVFVIGFLTVVLVLDCLFLILLVLMQLPKKEAGAGLAFGGAATDALFGAGSGNFLTKATKYAAIGFFVLTVVVSVLQNQYAHRSNSELRRLLEKTQAPAAAPATESSAPASAAVVSSSSNATTLLPLSSGSSVTNTAPKK